MKSLPLSSIKITNRQRRHFSEKALITLADSIREKGLLHPIVLQEDAITLVAGERRLRAIQMLADLSTGITCDGEQIPSGSIPYITIAALSPDDLIEAELEENILREDLTWQEEAEAIDRLHQLRISQLGPEATFASTAREIVGGPADSNARTHVSESTIISAHLSNPEVAKAKTRKDAMKIIKRQAEQKLTDSLANEFNILDTPHILNNGDFRNFTNFTATSSIDTIITDPPYGINADAFGDQAGATHAYSDTPEYFQEIMQDFFIEAARVTRDRAHLYLFCDPRWFSHITTLATEHGWKVWPTPIIWSKSNGMLPVPTGGPRRTYEFILFATKGDKPVRAVYNDVIDIQGLKTPRYGAEKPVNLYENLIFRSCRPGDSIWDPFVGAGPVFPAANRRDVQVVGTELSEEKFNFAKLRLDGKEDTKTTEVPENLDGLFS